MTLETKLNRFTLPNGLRVVHHPDPSSAMVVVNIIYNVGARDENPTLTGVAHLFEHLMFSGSKNVVSFDKAIERAGAANNAWTSNDYTSFYDIIPAHNVETAFWVESDRMLALNINAQSLSVQQGVVIEEFKQTFLNRPYGDMGHKLREMCYKVHPYRWPVIGLTPEHIANFTLEDARRFYETHYAPNNAVLVVGGNITLEEVERLTVKWFGDIPRREIAPRRYAAEPAQTAARIETVEAEVPATVLTVAYHMPGQHSPMFIPADLLTDILASGRSARLFTQILNRSELFTDVDASILGSDEPGLLMVSGRLRDNSQTTIDEARGLIDSTLSQLVERPVDDEELQRAKNRSISSFTLPMVDLEKRVSAIATREIAGLDFNRVVADYSAVTPEQVWEAARTILTADNSNTLIYGPAQG